MPKPDKGLSRRQVRQRVKQADQKARSRGATRRDVRALRQAHGTKKGCAVVGLALLGAVAVKAGDRL